MFLGSVSAIAMAAPQAAFADSQTAALQAEINALNAKLAKIEATQNRETLAAHMQAQKETRIEAQTEAFEEAQRQRNLAHNAKAQQLLQAETPTRAEQEGVQNHEYLTKGILPGSFIIPGTNTSIHLGGFINFQAEYSPTQNLGPKFSIGNLLPPSAARRVTAGDFQFQSKVSRMVFQTSTPSALGPITTNFALDFYGYVAGGDYNQALQNNSYSARIVYAYGTVGPLTMGMLNSNFIDDPDTPETFDNGGPAGIPAERTEQIRYTQPINKTSVVSIAAESPQSGYQDTRDNIEVPSQTEPMPDFSLRYDYNSPLLHFQLSGVVRDLAYTDGYGDRTSKMSGAGIIGGTLNLGELAKPFGKDNVGGQYWTGAIGRYIPDDFGGNIASVIAVDNGTTGTPRTLQTKLQDDQGFTVFYQHYWTALLRSTVSIGYNHQNLASFLPADVQNATATKTAHVNLILRPVPSVDLGIEAMIGQKDYQKSTGITPQNAERFEFGGIWHF
ncbi:MAG: hypothetical protein B7Z81_10315 [Acidocella sp. 20-61-6]|nr:MAG: hypothetical protein B7Z81_10315 [Acidocella sp. 20-61-6]